MLTKKRRGADADQDEGPPGDQEQEVQTQALLDSYFGKDDKLDGGELFLKDYIRKQVGALHRPHSLCGNLA